MKTVYLVPLKEEFYGFSSCEAKLVQVSRIAFDPEIYAVHMVKSRGRHESIEHMRQIASTELARSIIDDLVHVNCEGESITFEVGVLVQKEKLSLRRELRVLKHDKSNLQEDNVRLKRNVYNLLSINEELEHEVDYLRKRPIKQLVCRSIKSSWRALKLWIVTWK